MNIEDANRGSWTESKSKIEIWTMQELVSGNEMPGADNRENQDHNLHDKIMN